MGEKRVYSVEEAAKMIMEMTENQLAERTRLIIKGLGKLERRRKKSAT